MKIGSVQKEKELKAKSMVRTQFKMESLVYTQDIRYSKKLGKRNKEDLDPPLNGSSTVDNRGTLREMVKHLKSYYMMLQKCSRQLQREMMQMLQDKDKIQLLLQVDGGIQTKRIHLQSRLDRLTQARILLNEFSLNIFNFGVPELETEADVSPI